MSARNASRFKKWLQQQKERQDRIGRFARTLGDKEVVARSRRRRPDEHKNWADIVVRHGRQEFILIFNEAWSEYQKAAGA